MSLRRSLVWGLLLAAIVLLVAGNIIAYAHNVSYGGF
jgi:hypothetical protein